MKNRRNLLLRFLTFFGYCLVTKAAKRHEKICKEKMLQVDETTQNSHSLKSYEKTEKMKNHLQNRVSLVSVRDVGQSG